MFILRLSSNFTVHADEIRVNKLNGNDPNKADPLMKEAEYNYDHSDYVPRKERKSSFENEEQTQARESKIGSTADKASGPVNSTFYIEAVEATTITLSKIGSPTAGTAKYGINNTSPSTAYTYGESIDLTAG